MMMNYYSLFYSALSIISIIAYLGLLVFLFTRLSKFPKPTAIALVAVGAMLLFGLLRLVVPPLLSRVFETEQYLIANLIFNSFATMGHLGSIGILVWAVYAGREQISAYAAMGGSTVSSENPYGRPGGE